MLISSVEVPKLKETKEDTKGPQTEPPSPSYPGLQQDPPGEIQRKSSEMRKRTSVSNEKGTNYNMKKRNWNV